MKQLLLNLDVQRAQTLDTFVTGANGELLALLRRFADSQPGTGGERAAYIWGSHGAGKSHLLHAVAERTGAPYLEPGSPLAAFDRIDGTGLALVDDCQQLDAALQIAAFNLYNRTRDRGGLLLSAGALAPAGMPVREDLRTRLGWGLVYHVHELSDQEKIAALERAAATRGVILPAGVLPYLLTHFRRDMPSLSNLLEALINLSLEIKRPITLPFLREVMQQQLQTTTTP